MLTNAEIVDLLRQAAAAVQSAELPDDLRSVGFERALDAVGLARIPAASSAGTPALDSPPSGGTGGYTDASMDLLTRIGRRLELSPEVVERIYDVDDGTVRLAIRRAMLREPDRKAAAMRDVALLLVAGRQAAGEEQTALADVREECQALNVLDGPNFSSEVSKLDFRLRGPRNDRTAKANRNHFEEAADVIRGILKERHS
jgi:hypothetical protein